MLAVPVGWFTEPRFTRRAYDNLVRRLVYRRFVGIMHGVLLGVAYKTYRLRFCLPVWVCCWLLLGILLTACLGLAYLVLGFCLWCLWVPDTML